MGTGRLRSFWHSESGGRRIASVMSHRCGAALAPVVGALSGARMTPLSPLRCPPFKPVVLNPVRNFGLTLVSLLYGHARANRSTRSLRFRERIRNAQVSDRLRISRGKLSSADRRKEGLALVPSPITYDPHSQHHHSLRALSKRRRS